MTHFNRDYIMSKRITATPENIIIASNDLNAGREFINLVYREYDGVEHTHVCRIAAVSHVLLIERLPNAKEIEIGVRVDELISTVIKLDAIVMLEKRQYANESTYDRYYTKLWNSITGKMDTDLEDYKEI